MVLVALTMAVCLLVSAAIAFYVAFPNRGRSLRRSRTATSPASRGTESGPGAVPSQMGLTATEGAR